MPDFFPPDHLVGQDEDFPVLGMEGRRRLGLVLIQHAEAAGEGDLLLRAEILPGEDEHDVLQPRVVDLPMLRLAQRRPEVDSEIWAPAANPSGVTVTAFISWFPTRACLPNQLLISILLFVRQE